MLNLISVLHDPEGNLYDLTKENLGRVRHIFGTFTVVVSKATHKEVINLLKEFNLNIKFDEGKTYLAYRDALQYGALSSADYIFLIDFDRLMAWAKRNLNELMSVKDLQFYDYNLLERTEEAFRTHPPTQYKTEKLANFYISKLFKFKEDKDFLSGAWVFSKSLAWKIIESTKSTNKGFYGEWAVLGLKNAKNLGSYKFKGLEWELPYQFEKEINRNGLGSWIEKIELQEKNKRIQNLYLILNEAKKSA
ncbi:MAG: hypothetical protein U9Q69_00875 [Nanoarchaeota archaeon]|nr:hypothetical protein [Nanoarchaeota archaeon]